MRIKLQLYDDFFPAAGRSVFPTFDRFHCGLSQDRASAEQLSALDHAGRRNNGLHFHYASDVEALEGFRVFRFHPSQDLSIGCVLFASLGCRRMDTATESSRKGKDQKQPAPFAPTTVGYLTIRHNLQDLVRS